MIITITLNPAIDRTLTMETALVQGQVNRISHSYVEAGGKGINVSRAINALGGESIALGFSAGSNGRFLKDSLTSMNIHHDFVDVPGQTRVNVQIIDANGVHTDINEPGAPVSDADFLRFLERVQLYLNENNVFVLSGRTPPGFPEKSYLKLCRIIKDAGCPLILDADGDRLLTTLKYKPDFVKPNKAELFAATGIQAESPETALEGAKKLLEFGAQAVCVSMSWEGAVFASKNEKPIFVTPEACDHSDSPVATGDAMVGALANAMNQRLRFDEMAKMAVSMGTASAQLPGTQMANMKRMFEVYEKVKVYLL